MRERKRNPYNRKGSLGNAMTGIGEFISLERNARIHCAAACMAVAAGLYLGLSPREWAVVVLCIGTVISAEAFNTAIEVLCDRVIPGCDDSVRTVKDVSAGAVLIAACASAAVGLLIFVPKIISLI